jgi:hypothetical protein
MAKFSGGKFYIFAATRNSQTVLNAPATFAVADPQAVTATVLYDSSNPTPAPISIHAGSFTDTFAHAWDVKIYRIDSPNTWGVAQTIGGAINPHAQFSRKRFATEVAPRLAEDRAKDKLKPRGRPRMVPKPTRSRPL